MIFGQSLEPIEPPLAKYGKYAITPCFLDRGHCSGSSF
jgi:hypothetical protein